MTPAMEYEAYCSDKERREIAYRKALRCADCEHCHKWDAKAGGGTVPVGFCTLLDMPLAKGELESSQWDVCGEEGMQE